MAIAKIRSQHRQSPRDVIALLQDLIKHNDNRVNSVSMSFLSVGRSLDCVDFCRQYSDSSYVSSLVDALSNVITPAVAIAGTPLK